MTSYPVAPVPLHHHEQWPMSGARLPTTSNHCNDIQADLSMETLAQQGSPAPQQPWMLNGGTLRYAIEGAEREDQLRGDVVCACVAKQGIHYKLNRSECIRMLDRLRYEAASYLIET